MPSPAPGNTITLSPLWLLIGCLFIILLGALGGLIVQQFSAPVHTPLIKDLKPFVTNVQQVTVSANSLATKAVQDTQRSVVLLAQEGASGKKILASGLIITNDGLVVSVGQQAAKATSAIGSNGQSSPLVPVGADSLYGLNYFRLQDGVFTPLATTDANPDVGASLLLVTRSPLSFLPAAYDFFINEYAPVANQAPAITQVDRGRSATDSSFLAGAPAITEEGKVAGLLLDPEAGFLLPVSYLQRSIERVVGQQREVDPFTTLGFTPTYTYLDGPPATGRQFAMQITALTPHSRLESAGAKVGDRITKIGEVAVAVDTNIPTVLSTASTLTITRQTQELTISLTAPTITP